MSFERERLRERGKRKTGCVALLPLLFVTAAPHANAAAPSLDHLYPVAVPAGATTPVTAIGKFAPWPAQVWTDAPGITFEADKKSGQYHVTVSPEVPAGPHLVRLHNETGASAPRFLIVTADPQAAETEPNDDFAKPQLLEPLPVSLNGRLNKSGDVDSYAVKLDAGQTLIASLEAFVLASPVDAVLRLVDARGLELALNHDDGRTFDPALAWTAKTAGTYVLQVFGFAHPATADVRFTGSDACVYRLHVSRGPHARYTLPLGLQRGTTPVQRVFGWNLGTAYREFDVTTATAPPGSASLSWRHVGFENALSLPVGDGPEWTEPSFLVRTSDGPTQAPPFAITGCIEKIGEEDRFVFHANKDEKLVFEIQSASLGFPLDAWLAIQDAAGKERARNDDGPGVDPFLEWTVPETGSYTAVIGSVLHRAGPDHLYRLSVQAARPRFEAAIAESGFTVEPGKSAKIKVTARRIQGFKAKLTATAAGLPAGVTAEPVELGETEKETTLELKATAEAAPFSGPFQIQFREANSDTTHRAVHELTATSSRNGVPQGFRELVIRSTDQLWLTVLSGPAPKPKPAAVAEGKQ